MKTYSLKISAIIFLSLIFTSVFSQTEFTKNFEKKYSVNENTLFKITNKYGNVNIENSNSNTLEIFVTISINTKNKEKADNFFKKIAVNFDKSGDVISAETEIKENLKAKNFSINYHIIMPEKLKIELYNKYGDIFIDKLKSNSVILCKYGNLKINELLTGELSKSATVNLKYSNGNISKCDYVKADIKYSEMTIDESRVLNLTSGYSKLHLGKSYIIQGTSKYDPIYSVDEVTKFIMEGKYSDYKIDQLGNTLKVKIGYSNFKINNTSDNFSDIYIVGSYGNIKINVNKNASYKFNAKAEYGDISSLVKTVATEHGLTKLSSGFAGDNENSKSKITIVSKYGDIDVK